MGLIKSLKLYNFIRNMRKFLIKYGVFESEKDMEAFFTSGGCFIFAKICKRFFPNATFMISDKKRHCALKYGKCLFDIRGIVFDKNFSIVDKEDYEYMTNNFGFKEKLEKNFYEDFVDEICFCFSKNKKPNFSFTITTDN